MTTLTHKKAINIKPNDNPIPHGGVTGLSLFPSPNKGKGKWVLRFTSPSTGKRRNAGLGSFPSVGIADAAKKAMEMWDLISEGVDPLDQKRIEDSNPCLPIFELAAKTLHQTRSDGWRNEKHAKQWISSLETFAFPKIGKMKLDQITPADVASVLKPIWVDKPETASRVKQRIHAILAWGWAHGHCKSNPVDVVDHLLPKQPSKSTRTVHYPAMPWREIPKFIKDHIHNPQDNEITRPMLEMLILTACRSGEVRGMRWSEIDESSKIWTIPADRMKAHVEHRIPLTENALKILNKQRGLHKELIFPSPVAQKEMSNMALSELLRGLKATSQTTGRTATPHGFRSSFRDWASENGYSRDLAERTLAHTISNKVEAAYHRTDLLDQRREMMQAWDSFLYSMTKKLK